MAVNDTIFDMGGAVFNVKETAYGASGVFSTSSTAADDGAKIQAAVNAAYTAGGGTVLIPQGVYTMRSTVSVKPNVTLAGVGGGTILKRHPDFGSVDGVARLLVTEGSTFTGGVTGACVRDLVLDGNKGSVTNFSDPYFGYSNAVFDRASDCRFVNLHSVDSLYNGLIWQYCSDVEVHGCVAANNNKGGIYLSGCNRVRVSACQVSRHNNNPGMNVAASWWCTVAGSDLRKGTGVYGALHMGRDTEWCSVTGNYIEGFATESEPVGTLPTELARPGAPTYGTGVPYAIYNCVLANNVIVNHDQGSGVRLFRSNRNRVTGNLIAGSSQWGVLLYGSSRNSVSGNQIVDNGATSGTHSVLVTALETEYGGDAADDNVIEGNDVRDDRGTPLAYGIRVAANVKRAVIRNNRISTSTPIDVDSTATAARYGNFVPGTGSTLGTVDGGITI